MRQTLRNKEIRALAQTIEKEYGVKNIIDKKAIVERLDSYFLVNNSITFFKYEKQIIPSIRTLLKCQFLPAVEVDTGAVKFVVNGANIMRPGIVHIDTFPSGACVAIIDTQHKQPLAVGKALYTSEEIQKKNKGIVVKNLHYVGDDMWKFQ